MSPSPVPLTARVVEPAVSPQRPLPGGLVVARRPKPAGIVVEHRPRPTGRHALETVSRRARPWRLAGSLD